MGFTLMRVVGGLLGAAGSLAVSVAVAAAGAKSSPAGGRAGAPAKKPFQVTWLGHAAFEIASPGGTRLLVDPFLKQNPKTPEEFKDLARYKPAAILVTHSHSDHAADALEIARASGASVIGVYDWVESLDLPDKQKQGGNVGGVFVVGDVTVHLVPAMHSSAPSGRPMGFVLVFADGRRLYHTGDTWIFGDMALIQEIYHPNVILLNVGGGPFGEDPKTAALAIRKYFTPEVIVPMHFGTFPGLSTEADVTAAFHGDRRLVLMTPGQTKEF
jgi:L-ascorbate metabolism protein UlaG (beta-lactamase superfamily)